METIYDTGKLPLWVRIPLAITGIAFAGFAAFLTLEHLQIIRTAILVKEQGSWVIGALIAFGLGIFFVSTFFLRNLFLYDAQNKNIVIRHWNILGMRERKISLANAKSISAEEGWGSRASKAWNIRILLSDEKSIWLTKFYSKEEAMKVANSFSESTGLPLVNGGL